MDCGKALRRVLHAGCNGGPLPPYFGECEEVRLDVDPQWRPDVLASITDLGDIGVFDAVYCSHTLEHLYPHEVKTALREFRRVLSDDGYVMIWVPDLEDVRPTEELLFESPSGPIAGLDLYYGFRPKLAEMPHMAHHTGFTSTTLEAALREAGFTGVTMRRFEPLYQLMAVAKG